eukprot:TRINITY_DN15683_c0_g1_i12.p1 TRINITY_DN15683_c0_g1~~TRINITY_DN15683_c0_g1_i12.p1  ORF type:complete len:375 (+),score=94.94 TRINITY_DN15683_c0_g1_i12:49-1125(+)
MSVHDKTSKCTFFGEGRCKNSAATCRYLHDPCDNYTKFGKCMNGGDCKYEHIQKGQNVNTERKATKCIYFGEGKCKNSAAACKFLHDPCDNFTRTDKCMNGDDCKYEHIKTTKCIYFGEGRCKNSAAACKFLHDPCDNYAKFGKCMNGDNCKYEHTIQKGQNLSTERKATKCIYFGEGKCKNSAAACRFLHDPCDNYTRTGKCMNGDDCKYEHIKYEHKGQDLGTQQKTTKCIYFGEGKCKNSAATCRYLHDPCDNYVKLGKCTNGDDCKYEHRDLGTVSEPKAASGNYQNMHVGHSEGLHPNTAPEQPREANSKNKTGKAKSTAKGMPASPTSVQGSPVACSGAPGTASGGRATGQW